MEIKQFSQMPPLLPVREEKTEKRRYSHDEKSQLKQPRFSLEGGRKLETIGMKKRSCPAHFLSHHPTPSYIFSCQQLLELRNDRSEQTNPSPCPCQQGDPLPTASALQQGSARARSCFPVGSPWNQVQRLISAGQLDLVPFVALFPSSQMDFVKASREVWGNFHSADPRTGFTTPSSCRVLLLQP